LRNAGIQFTVQASDIDETPFPGESPRNCAERLAREKALAVAQTRPHDYVLGADTIVVVGEEILNKPIDAGDARRMLRMLSGRTHAVITGVCLVSPVSSEDERLRTKNQELRTKNRELRTKNRELRTENQELRTESRELRTENWELRTASESTLVTMNELSDEEIRNYIATGEPMDKAGAYAIQGIAARWIPRIAGDYSNVVGLPLDLVCRMLREQGVL